MSRITKIFLALFALAFAPVAGAVVVVGGDNGWEVSFDGNVNGLYVYEDTDEAPSLLSARQVCGEATFDLTDGCAADDLRNQLDRDLNADILEADAADIAITTRRGGGIGNPGDSSSRIRTGLLPAFFSFNVRSPEVSGLRGSARISFSPQIQNANRKNNFGNGTQAGSQIELREVFFNVEGSFGTLSAGRTLSLHQRHSILTDMTLFGSGVQGGTAGGGTTLGRIGYGYVYPQFNARISYKTPEVSGFQWEVGVYDPSVIRSEDAGRLANWDETSVPRFETEATYAQSFNSTRVKLWAGGLWQEADSADTSLAARGAQDSVTAYGVHGGIQLGFEGLELVANGYYGEGLGTILMLDSDSVDRCGNERDNYGFILQATYTFQGRTKFGVSYGETNADETDVDTALRTGRIGTANDAADHCSTFLAAAPTDLTGDLTDTLLDPAVASQAPSAGIESLSSVSVGVYHDVTTWFKVIAEYTYVEDQWHDGTDRNADVFSVGGFFLW